MAEEVYDRLRVFAELLHGLVIRLEQQRFDG